MSKRKSAGGWRSASGTRLAGVTKAYPKTCGFKMMLHQPGDIRIVFEDAYGLTQLALPYIRAAQDTAT